jgi:hypothetical protein
MTGNLTRYFYLQPRTGDSFFLDKDCRELCELFVSLPGTIQNQE